MLGHASSQTTQRYAHLADSRAMREASMAAVTMLTNTDR
jgi:integrase